MRVRPTYTEEFKADAVAHLKRSDQSVGKVAEGLGVSVVSLRSWYKREEMAKKKGKGNGKVVAANALKGHDVAPNQVARDFTATRPNERWVTDITYVWTDEGWSYVAAILDLFSCSVVGWAVQKSLATMLPLAALDMAIRRRRPGEGLMHHADRGCQYTSANYREPLSALGVTVSISRKGNCWDSRRRVILRDPQKRAHSPPFVAEPYDLTRRALRLHRGLLQSPPTAVDNRLQDAAEVDRDYALSTAA
jgi:transposase InsO family protein